MHVSRCGLLTTSSVLMLLATVAHTIGNLMLPSDPGVVGIYTAMRSSHPPVGMGMYPSMFEVHMLLVLTMTATFAAIPPPLISGVAIELPLAAALLVK